ncbi:hypothetical protein CC79DRAFT_1364277 [Sarocladium strictum]
MPLEQRQSGGFQPIIVDPPGHGDSSQSNSLYSEEESHHDELAGLDDDWEDDYEDVQPSDSASASHDRSQVRHRPAPVARRRHRVPQRTQVQQHPQRAGPAYPPASPPSFMDSSDDYPQYPPQRGYHGQQAYYGGQGQVYHQSHGRGGGHVSPYGQGYPGGPGGQMVPSSYYDHAFSPMSNGGNGPGYFGPEPRHYAMAPYQQPQYYGGHPQYNVPPALQQYQMAPHIPPPATEAPPPSTTPAPDPEKEKIKAQLEALQAERDKAEMMQRQAAIEAKIRQNAEENFRQRMEAMKIAAEEHKRELESARIEAERTARERIEAERKADDERQKQHADAMKRAEENARARIEAEMKAAEEARKREDEARAKAEELARIRYEAAMKKEAEAKAEAEKRAAEEVERLKRIQEDAKMKAEAEAAKKIAEEKEAEKKKADAEAEAAKEAEALKKKIEDETKAKMEADAKSGEKKPIRFKDAVGRKFSFPFHLCQTWAGMEELIKQAFIQVEKLGPHVQEGRYDLTGPDGEIILPSVWDKVIQPDWQIVMTMWPIEDAPPPLDHRFQPFMPGGKHRKGGPPPMAAHISSKRPGVAIPPAPPDGWPPRGPGIIPDGVKVVNGGEPSSKRDKERKRQSGFASFLTGQSGKKSTKKKSSSRRP